ncbi:hypothetical protein KIH79_11960, partial [Bifidobacterium sp. 82T10]|nr:hypothetical protein [Bifidobacterium miconis]
MGDREFMSVALRHARLGAGKVNPNPMVGAVIVRDGRGGRFECGAFGVPSTEVIVMARGDDA